MAGDVINNLAVVDAIGAIVDIAGAFLSFVSLFLPDEDALILQELKKIEQQIANLRSDMGYYFSKAIDASEQDACFS